ncbi:hypothetical protein R3W88_008643 [Solanum pinnatisectum]|uniref:RNase H type-1 domain-containing protein n=1 Tax=Solanum pinnatisectum TaxID=50273 RepID=A0AAV9MC95_9SOLN|nr:hypothetical protein R3W88_008643 [Solanum pinnatisectum]
MTNQASISINWTPPPTGTFKLNIDGATNITKGIGGIGGVIRNNKGDWVIGFIGKTPHTNPTMVKL